MQIETRRNKNSTESKCWDHPMIKTNLFKLGLGRGERHLNPVEMAMGKRLRSIDDDNECHLHPQPTSLWMSWVPKLICYFELCSVDHSLPVFPRICPSETKGCSA